MVMVVKNGPNFVSTYYPSAQDMNDFNLFEYGTLQRMKYGCVEQTALMVKPPDDFVQLFNINSSLFSNTLDERSDISTVIKLSLQPMEGYTGFYEHVVEQLPVKGAKQKIMNLLARMKPSNDYDWKTYFGRKRLGTLKCNTYFPDIAYSYIDEVYKQMPSLPTGWRLNGCTSFLHDIYGSARYYGINKATGFFSDFKTGCGMHCDSYGLPVCCFNLPGGADKIWCIIHPRYEDRLNDILKDSAMCPGPFNHNSISLDHQILDQLDFPYWIAKQKPGTFLFLLPNMLHQVANTGIGFMESIAYVDDRWDVESHRRHVLCCDERETYYKKAMWKPLKHYYRQSEQEMDEQWKRFKTSSPFVLKPETKIGKKTMAITNESNDRGTFVQEFVELVATSSPNTVAVEDAGLSEAEHENSSPSITDQIYDSTFNVTTDASLDIQMVESTAATTLTTEKDSFLSNLLASVAPPIIVDVKVSMGIYSNKNDELSADTAELIKEADERDRKRKRDTPSKQNYEKDKRVRHEYVPKDADPHVRKIDNGLNYQRSKCRELREDLKKHRARIEELAPDVYKREVERLEGLCAWRGELIAQGEQRRDLYHALNETFGPDLMEKKKLQGYVTYEVARDFINGESVDDRERFFLNFRNRFSSKHLNLWREVTASAENWKRTFGIHRERIPAKYQSTL